VADLGFFWNPMRTEGVWAYGTFLCTCELRRGHNYQCIKMSGSFETVNYDG